MFFEDGPGVTGGGPNRGPKAGARRMSDSMNFEPSVGYDDDPGAGNQGPIYDDDKLGRKIRGMGNVLDDELLDYKSDPNERGNRD